jgi:hypothetical protein
MKKISRDFKNSFTQVILKVLSLIFFSLSVLMIFTPNQVSLVTHIGVSGEISLITLQFLGTAYFLIGCLLHILKNLQGKQLRNVLISINLMGFLHLFLIFKSNSFIALPYVYFIFQILVQLILIYCLLDKNRDSK